MKRQSLFILGFVAVMGLALSLRVGNLGARPMHADEGNNTIIFQELYETGRYIYSPLDHHGPSLYYVTLPFVWMSGAADFNSTDEATYRAVSVACGLLLIAMLWLVCDGLGRPALNMAAALLAVSPAFVFYNRYYIHEPLLLVFNFGLLAAGWRYAMRPHIGWAIVAGLCAGLSFATKETCVILWTAMTLGAVVVWYIERRAAMKAAVPATVGTAVHASSTIINPSHDNTPANALTSRPLPSIDWRHLVAAAVAALVPVVLLFSAFFRHPRGIVDSVLSYFNYAQRAQGAGHEAPWYTYLKLLAYFHRKEEVLRAPIWSEGLILGLAIIGAVVAATGCWLSPMHRRFARFILVYTLFTTAVFAAIPYKTPWNVLPFFQGMILLAGIGVAALMARAALLPRIALAVALAFGLIHLRNQAVLANSERYFASRANPYVYAHTTTDTVRHLVPFVERLAAAAPDNQPFIIQIYCDNAWPLPWYLRRFKHVGYGTQQKLHPRASLILVELSRHDDLAQWQKKLGNDWRNPGSYTLRPNVFLTAFVREELFQAMLNLPADPAAAK